MAPVTAWPLALLLDLQGVLLATAPLVARSWLEREFGCGAG